jgi:hypothetical protein
VSGTPLFEADRFLIKFHNLWTIEAPEGYAVLFTHPLNRVDLPFTTLTGIVDCDRYHDNWIHFPARWNDPNFSGVLPKGTPVAQCVPVKRESWVLDTGPFTAEEAQRVHDLTFAIRGEVSTGGDSACDVDEARRRTSGKEQPQRRAPRACIMGTADEPAR